MTFTSDAAGPDHTPVTLPLGIDGVLAQKFPSVAYRHGSLTEVVNAQWDGMYSEPIGHLYFISNPNATVREEWYVHHHITDRYLVIDGHVDVALYDDRADSSTTGELIVVELQGLAHETFSGLVIPQGIWHSFSSRVGKLLLMNAKIPGYNRLEPDKHRIPMPNAKVDFVWPVRV